jgi:hypothetical protein
MNWIYKFAKNLTVGDFVVPSWSEPGFHAYWKVLEVNQDNVRFQSASQTVVADLNDVFIIRPDAPLYVRNELYNEYYGPGGLYHPWPYDYKNKHMSRLRAEIGEDLSADLFRKWKNEAYNKSKKIGKGERPEPVIRKTHERAVEEYYKSEDLVSQACGPQITGQVSVQQVLERYPEVPLEPPVCTP